MRTSVAKLARKVSHSRTSTPVTRRRRGRAGSTRNAASEGATSLPPQASNAHALDMSVNALLHCFYLAEKEDMETALLYMDQWCNLMRGNRLVADEQRKLEEFVFAWKYLEEGSRIGDLPVELAGKAHDAALLRLVNDMKPGSDSHVLGMFANLFYSVAVAPFPARRQLLALVAACQAHPRIEHYAKAARTLLDISKFQGELEHVCEALDLTDARLIADKRIEQHHRTEREG